MMKIYITHRKIVLHKFQDTRKKKILSIDLWRGKVAYIQRTNKHFYVYECFVWMPVSQIPAVLVEARRGQSNPLQLELQTVVALSYSY